MDNSWTKHLQPFIVVEDLQLCWRFGEREVSIHPAHLNISKQVPRQILQHLFEVSLSDDLPFFCVFSSNVLEFVSANSLHLVECRVMSAVHSVLPVNITHANKSLVASTHQGDLMHWSVWTQTDLSWFVVSVCGSSADVVLGDAQIIKALFDLNQGIKIREYFELLSWYL